MNEKILRKLLINLNQHLPKERISLSEALRMERATYEGKDGRTYVISRGELSLISELLPEIRRDFLRVPIILRGDPMSENPGWIISGADECKIIAAILDKPLPDGDRTAEMKLYPAHVRELRKTLPTATIMMSSM